MIYDLQLSRILGIIAVGQQPQHTLRACQSVLGRRQRTRPDLVNYSQEICERLKEWTLCESSSLLLVHPGPGAKAKAQGLPTVIVENLRGLNKPVIWSLSTGSTTSEPPSTVSILKELISQALQLAISGSQYQAPASLSAASFQVAHTQSEWLSLLFKILSCNQETFIVIETEDLFRSTWNDYEIARDFLSLFQTMMERSDGTSRIKTLVVCYSVSLLTSKQGARPMTLAVEASTLNGRRFLPRRRGRGRCRGSGVAQRILLEST
jgi:hypothetical protein